MYPFGVVSCVFLLLLCWIFHSHLFFVYDHQNFTLFVFFIHTLSDSNEIVSIFSLFYCQHDFLVAYLLCSSLKPHSDHTYYILKRPSQFLLPLACIHSLQHEHVNTHTARCLERASYNSSLQYCCVVQTTQKK